uniref:Uncharacterized protein n=1 Tax=Sphaerodactylus townsendi TaxID=933632 RepID=A0ACB8FSJ8_9SAUR
MTARDGVGVGGGTGSVCIHFPLNSKVNIPLCKHYEKVPGTSSPSRSPAFSTLCFPRFLFFHPWSNEAKNLFSPFFFFLSPVWGGDGGKWRRVKGYYKENFQGGVREQAQYYSPTPQEQPF